MRLSALVMGPETFSLKASILILVGGKKVVLIKCGAGSIMARERAALALARMFTDYQIPLTIVTNSEDATLLNTLNGETLECGLRSHSGKGAASRSTGGICRMCLFGKTPEDGKADLISL